MGDGANQLLARPIQLADQVARCAEDAQSCRQECAKLLRSRAARLADLLRQAARAELYERPARRIVANTEQSLENAFALLSRCRSHGVVGRVLTTIHASDFDRAAAQLDGSIGNVSWLLRASSSFSTCYGEDGDTDMLLDCPPIAQSQPILSFIWGKIATLRTGSLEARSEAAAALASLADDSDRKGKLIIGEEGVGPLLQLVKEGQVEGQENAVRAIALLGRDPENVDGMVHLGVCSVFAQVLRDAPMRTQAVVAWAVAELAAAYPRCQDLFAQNNVIRLLVDHLASETEQKHDRMRSVVHSAKPSKHHPCCSDNPTMARHREKPLFASEDSDTGTKMKAMAANALWQLAKGNPAVCKSIAESKALIRFANLLEKGPKEVRYNSVMALMEIAKVAEHDADIQHSAFRPKSPAAKAVLDQLLSVVEKADCDDLLAPCVISLGCLSRTFRVTGTRIIGPLVRLLDERETALLKEVVIALTKFACTENNLCLDHSMAIVVAGGLEHLLQLVYFGEKVVQVAALVLLCYIALHVPDSKDLVQKNVLSVLQWASTGVHLVQDPRVDSLLPKAMGRLAPYQDQARGSRGFG